MKIKHRLLIRLWWMWLRFRLMAPFLLAAEWAHNAMVRRLVALAAEARAVETELEAIKAAADQS